MPPAIQSTINVSAVGAISEARSRFGAAPANAASAAAAGICRKSRRRREAARRFSSRIILLNELKFRRHHNAPEQISQALIRNFTGIRQQMEREHMLLG